MAARHRLVLEPQLGAPGAADVGRAGLEPQQAVLVAVLDDEIAAGRGPRPGDGPQPSAVGHPRQGVEALGLRRRVRRAGAPGLDGGGKKRGGHA